MPTLWWHVAQVVMLVCLIGLLIFGVVKPSSKTVYTQPVTQNHQFENLVVKFGGCASFPVQSAKEKK